MESNLSPLLTWAQRSEKLGARVTFGAGEGQEERAQLTLASPSVLATSPVSILAPVEAMIAAGEPENAD